MPYFTHLRKKSSFAVVETGDKLYIDGQGYNPDTLKPVIGAEFDVFSPTANAHDFFDFGTPVVCLPRTSVICSASLVQSKASGKNRVFDSTVYFSGQNYGTVAVLKTASGYVMSCKQDPSATSKTQDRFLFLDQSFLAYQQSGDVTMNEGTEVAPYRLATMFWSQGSDSDPVLGFNSRYLNNSTATSNNRFTLSGDTSTYTRADAEKNNIQQLFFHDPSKVFSADGLSLVGKMPINSSGLSQPEIYAVQPSDGIKASVQCDFPLEKFWFRRGENSYRGMAAITTDKTGKYLYSAADYVSGGTHRLSKYETETGKHLLSKEIGMSSYAEDMFTDTSGNVYVVSSNGIELIKYDSNLEKVWGVRFNVGNVSYVKGGFADDDGTIYVAGPTNFSGGTRDAHISAISSSGAVLWSKRYGTNNSGENWSSDVCQDRSNSSYIYVCGAIGVMKLQKSDGSIVWRKKYTGAGSNTRVRSDSLGNVYLIGNNNKIFKLNSSGDYVWGRSYDASIYDFFEIEITSDNEIYIAGRASTASVEAGGFVLIRLDPGGSSVWQRKIQQSSYQPPNALGLHVDKYKNIHVQGFFPTLSSVGLGFWSAKLPSDGSGTGTYGDLSYESIYYSFGDVSSGTVNSGMPGSYSPTAATIAGYSSSSASDIAATSYPVSVTSSSVYNKYVGGLFSNAIWETSFYGLGPLFFVPATKPFADEAFSLVFGRFAPYTSPFMVKGITATISNPQSLSLLSNYDSENRCVRPFLFKNDSSQLMLGVVDQYTGTNSTKNRSSLMLFSVGSTALEDSITLTYLQRIDLSDGGTGFITSVTPVDDTQRSWVVNYGDKAKLYTWSQASNFTLTNTYGWGRSGQVDSYGIDSRGRLWYTTGDVLSYIPLKADPATVDTSLRAYFDSSAYTYTGTPISSNLYVSAYSLDGGREQRSVTVTLGGGSVRFADGTTTKTVTTSGSGDLALPITVLGSGIFQAKLS